MTRFEAGNSDIPGYISTFSTLEKEQLLGKVVRLSVSEKLEEAESSLPSLPRLVLEGLFMGEKLPRVVTKLAPLSVAPVGTVTTNGGLISPQSPARTGGRIIDPSLVCDLCNKIPYPYCALTFRFTAATQTYVVVFSDERNLMLCELKKTLRLATNII
jgi:hypothetical protein